MTRRFLLSLASLAALASLDGVLAACGSSPGSPAAAASTGATATGSGSSSGTGGGSASTGTGGSAAASCTPTYDATTVHLALAAKVATGAEATMCLRWTTPADLDISAFVGTLGPGGHHALLVARKAGADPDGISPCTEPELMDAQLKGSFQMLAGVSYESDGKKFAFPVFPVQVGLHVAAGTQLVFDAHFLNAGSAPLEGCATLDLARGKPVIAKLEFRTVVPKEEFALVVPAHGMVTVSYEEAVGGHYRIGAASSHMHQGGKHFRMSIKETDTTLYETTNWAEPTPATFLSQKIVVDVPQTFKLDCTFENTTSQPQHFPTQMCVGGMYLLPCTLPGAC